MDSFEKISLMFYTQNTSGMNDNDFLYIEGRTLFFKVNIFVINDGGIYTQIFDFHLKIFGIVK